MERGWVVDELDILPLVTVFGSWVCFYFCLSVIIGSVVFCGAREKTEEQFVIPPSVCLFVLCFCVQCLEAKLSGYSFHGIVDELKYI